MNSKNTIITVGIIGVFLAGAILLVIFFPPPSSTSKKTLSTNNALSAYSNPAYGLSFQYPKKYFLEEKEIGNAIRAHHVLTLTLDSIENKRIREGKIPGREIPSYIVIDIYQNSSDRLSAIDWLKKRTDESHFPSGATYTETVISGVPAFLYSRAGLRRTESIAFNSGAWLYSVAVVYNDPKDIIRTDYWDVIVKTLSLKN